MRPGPLEDTLGLVELPGQTTTPATGALLLTTVAVDDGLGPVQWLRARASAVVEVVPREQVFPPHLDPDEVAEQNAALMADSQLNASVAALDLLGFDIEGEGARIAAVTPDAVTDAFEVDDIVVAADGRPVRDSATAAEVVQAAAPGDTVVFEVRRDGDLREVAVELGESPERAGSAYVGVLLVTELDLPVEVRIDAGRIGGPSAGMMFALSIIELLGDEDLTAGQVVAGTGTVAFDGSIGAVGGVRQKLVAASAGVGGDPAASVFLVPRANADQARRAPVERDIVVVPVDTLEQAVDALLRLGDGRMPPDAFTLRAGGGVLDARSLAAPR